jgi:ferredoxin
MVDEIAAALSPSGLVLRGGFNFNDDEVRPPSSRGPARSVILICNAGATYWPHFQRWREKQPAGLADPLDTWCRETIGGIAQRFGARAVSPSDRPYLPFQQWAMRAEGLKPSPLGILMHPEYGLWHAYRGALLFDVALAIQAPEKMIHLCDACVGKPCLKACPVDAHSAISFSHQACLAHVRGEHGTRCRSTGCLDRNACPYGGAYRYPPDVQAFHMAAFAAL